MTLTDLVKGVSGALSPRQALPQYSGANYGNHSRLQRARSQVRKSVRVIWRKPKRMFCSLLGPTDRATKSRVHWRSIKHIFCWLCIDLPTELRSHESVGGLPNISSVGYLELPTKVRSHKVTQ